MATSHYDFFAAPGTATRGTYHELRIPDEYDADGAPLVFHLGQMEIGERLLAEDMAATLTTLYVTGDESRGIKPVPFPPTDRGAPVLSESLLRVCARIYQIQDMSKPHVDVENLVAMSRTRPRAFDALSEQAMRIQAGYSPRGEYVGDEVAGDAGEATPPAGSC